MKLKVILFVITLCVMTSGIVYGQGGTFAIFWTNVDLGANPNWYPLVYDCEAPESDTLRDGTIIRMFRSSNMNPPNPETDVPLTVGLDGAAGEVWPASHFVFNSESLISSGATAGSFRSDILHWEGAVPNPVAFIFYLQIGCWNEDSTEWTCSYYSHRMMPSAGYSEYLLGAQQVNPFCDPVWTCVGACPEPVDATDNSLGEIPQLFDLEAFPNPFNPSTLIRFTVEQTAIVELTIYDIAGREIERLLNGVLTGGLHEVEFNGADLPSGIYFATLKTANRSLTKKLVLLK